MTTTTITPGVRTTDIIILRRRNTGQWTFDYQKGEIYHTGTGKPLKFRLNNDGYLCHTTQEHGLSFSITKHRAIWIAATATIPIDLTLEVDHINGSKTDCRIQNLRLITHKENSRTGRPGNKRFTEDTIRQIRTLSQSGTTTAELGQTYAVSQSCISRIIRGVTYRSVT